MHIKKGDKVVILSGKDKGKSGEVTHAFPKDGKVTVAGVNIFKKHQRATKRGTKGQVIDIEMPIAASKVKKAEK